MASHLYQEVFMKPAVAVLYADASAAALVDALKHWRQDHAPSASYESLLAEHLNVIQCKTRILPEGRAVITVVCEAKGLRQDDGYYYEATLLAGELKLEKITD